MRKLFIAAAIAVVAAAVPAAASATPGNGHGNSSSTPSPSQVCRAERSAMGAATFKATYGTNKNRANAFGKCVSRHATEQNADSTSAAKQCRTERNADAAAFKTKYGTNHNKSNAFGKCVSTKAKAAANDRKTAEINAAKQCRTERNAGAAAFKTKYGTNHNKSNAFGKCVSAKAKAQSSS